MKNEAKNLLKIEQAKKLLSVLVKKTDSNFIPCERYYKVLKIYQNLIIERRNINLEIEKAPRIVNIKTRCYFDSPEATVTSTTYERAKKRMHKQITDRFKSRL